MTEHKHEWYLFVDGANDLYATCINECGELLNEEEIGRRLNAYEADQELIAKLVEALMYADQTLRNFAHGDLTGHSSEIAFNAAARLQKVYKPLLAKGEAE